MSEMNLCRRNLLKAGAAAAAGIMASAAANAGIPAAKVEKNTMSSSSAPALPVWPAPSRLAAPAKRF